MLIKTRVIQNGREYYIHHENNELVSVIKDEVNLTASLNRKDKERLLRIALQVEKWNGEDKKNDPI